MVQVELDIMLLPGAQENPKTRHRGNFRGGQRFQPSELFDAVTRIGAQFLDIRGRKAIILGTPSFNDRTP